MSKFCEMCGKGYLKGRLVCFSNKKALKRSYPNLRSVKVTVDGSAQKIRACTGCLSSVKNAAIVAEKAKLLTTQVS